MRIGSLLTLGASATTGNNRFISEQRIGDSAIFSSTLNNSLQSDEACALTRRVPCGCYCADYDNSSNKNLLVSKFSVNGLVVRGLILNNKNEE